MHATSVLVSTEKILKYMEHLQEGLYLNVQHVSDLWGNVVGCGQAQPGALSDSLLLTS